MYVYVYMYVDTVRNMPHYQCVVVIVLSFLLLYMLPVREFMFLSDTGNVARVK